PNLPFSSKVKNTFSACSFDKKGIIDDNDKSLKLSGLLIKASTNSSKSSSSKHNSSSNEVLNSFARSSHASIVGKPNPNSHLETSCLVIESLSARSS
ncbi:MAG TPA: hypothetical protein VK005_00645, partial [Acholeplasma sp.]|nr:hypothetical protein [Acholeplasma sp.]